MTELVCGTEHMKKLEAVHLSNDTINSRIIGIPNNILEQVMEELKASPSDLLAFLIIFWNK